jgi:hypothetical protein
MPLAGRGGSVKFSSSTGGTPTAVADLREWSLNVEADMFEVSTFGSSGWKRFQPNLTGAQGTISGYWNVQSSTSMKAIQTEILTLQTTPSEIRLLVDNTNQNGYTGDVWVTGISPGAAVDAIVPFTANITIHGPVTYSTAL